MKSQKHILVIGAGGSGLSAIKSCKEEGLYVVCYEKTKYFGGRWRYRENNIPGVVSVMKSTICITSKEMEAFSDFPPPSHFPNYLHHSKMLAYLTMYAEKFDLLRHIKYQREVLKIIPSAEFSSNGKWLVISINRLNNSESAEEYDGVMVCSGRMSELVIPSISNHNVFKGFTLHSQSLKTFTAFEDLNVLIIGNGNSAVDAAVEISTVAKQVYLSTRNGFWLFPKMGPKGLPYDMHLIRRDIHCLKKMCCSYINSLVEKYLETKINHEACKIKPPHRAMDKPPTVNDDLPDKILTGRVIVKGSILRFEENGVVFEHEDNLTEVDCVIFATGYTTNLSFVDKEIHLNKNGTCNLYKYVFPVELKHPTIAFIGFTRSNGAQLPIAESQSRWASRIFAGKLNLPPKQVMKKSILTKIFYKKTSHEIIVDYIEYMDELAQEYGVKPDMYSLLFKDTKLFWTCFTGPFLPYQYRLSGPHKVNQARDFILEYHQRIIGAFNTKKTKKDI